MDPCEAAFELEARLPGSSEVLRVAFRVSATEARAFESLPRDREIPEMVRSRIRAEEQNHQRQCIVRAMAESMAEKMMKLIESRDPQFGYSPEQWREMNREETKSTKG
jgi:hypothetical protein